MNQALVIAGTITAAAFVAAAISLLAYIPRKWGGSSAPMLILAAAFMLEAFIGFSNVLQYAGVTGALDLFEDFAEILFAPLVVFSLFATEVQLRLREQERASRVVQSEHDMLLSIVDTTPSGILIVAPGGHITFANEAARSMLGVAEDEGTGRLTAEAWEMTDESGAASSLGELLDAPEATGLKRAIVFPDGKRSALIFSVTTMGDHSSELGGAVVAVERAL